MGGEERDRFDFLGSRRGRGRRTGLLFRFAAALCAGLGSWHKRSQPSTKLCLVDLVSEYVTFRDWMLIRVSIRHWGVETVIFLQNLQHPQEWPL